MLLTGAIAHHYLTFSTRAPRNWLLYSSSVEAAGGEEVIVASLFDDAAFVHHQDEISTRMVERR